MNLPRIKYVFAFGKWSFSRSLHFQLLVQISFRWFWFFCSALLLQSLLSIFLEPTFLDKFWRKLADLVINRANCWVGDFLIWILTCLSSIFCLFLSLFHIISLTLNVNTGCFTIIDVSSLWIGPFRVTLILIFLFSSIYIFATILTWVYLLFRFY